MEIQQASVSIGGTTIIFGKAPMGHYGHGVSDYIERQATFPITGIEFKTAVVTATLTSEGVGSPFVVYQTCVTDAGQVKISAVNAKGDKTDTTDFECNYIIIGKKTIEHD